MKETDLKGLDDRTAAFALTGLFSSLHGRRATPEERAIQRGIDATMRETLRSKPDNFARDQNCSPGSGGPASPKAGGRGWVDPPGLAGSVPYQDAIARIADRLEPHSPEYILRQKKLTPAQLDELRREVVAKGPELAWLVPIVDRVRAAA